MLSTKTASSEEQLVSLILRNSTTDVSCLFVALVPEIVPIRSTLSATRTQTLLVYYNCYCLCFLDGSICQSILNYRMAKADFDGIKVIGRGAFGQVQVVSLFIATQ